MFSRAIQVHSLFHTESPLQSQTCKRPSLPLKDHKIHLSCQFFVRTHYNSALQKKTGATGPVYSLFLLMILVRSFIMINNGVEIILALFKDMLAF